MPATHLQGGAAQEAIRTHSVAGSALFKIVGAAALIALGAQVRILVPGTPVPMTLQSLALLLVGLILAPRLAGTATVLYLLCGAAGLPVFAANSASLLGVTGGYLLGFFPAVVVAGWWKGRGSARFGRLLAAGVLAYFVLFACGVAWQVTVWGVSLEAACAIGFVPFAAKAAVEVALVAVLVARLDRARRSG